MHDLNSWRWLLNAPQQIPFGRMTLLVGDFDPPVTEGSGVAYVESNSQFRFQVGPLEAADESLCLQLPGESRHENPNALWA